MMAKRLTKRNGENVYYTLGKYPETLPVECETADVRTILRALADYEDAEEQSCPLTLEQLREMVDRLVWVQDLLIPSCSAWHFVKEFDGSIYLFDEVALARKIVGYNATTGHNYGKTWTAYAQRPEEAAP